MSRRILSLWLPSLAIDSVVRRRPELGGRPLAVTVPGGRGGLTVVALSPEAAAAGIAPGMALSDARTLLPGLPTVEADPRAEGTVLDGLADWAGRYTPWLAVDGPDGLILDITGCAHLFGGEAGMAADMAARLGRAGFGIRIGLADTPGAARALARFGPAGSRLVAPGAQREALAGLPVAALGLAPETVAALVRVGLRRIGDLYPLPRRSLAARFGLEIGRRLDRALGAEDEPVAPRMPAAPHTARLAFAEPISTAEAITAAVERLLQAVCAGLLRAGEGARRLELRCHRVDGGWEHPPQVIAVGTSRPVRSAPALGRLLAERLSRIEPGPGLEVLILSAPLSEPLAAAQLEFDGGGGDADDDLGGLIDRLEVRLGPASVCRPRSVDSWWPERAVAWGPALESDAGPGWPSDRPRPLRLLARPEPVEAMAPVPDDPPVMFRWRGAVYRVSKAEGPERLEPEWWRGLDEARDYYRVEDADGHRYWLFRAGLYRSGAAPRWFLHGIFA